MSYLNTAKATLEDVDKMKRKVQYYETDMMGITNHANYIHWIEERIEQKDSDNLTATTHKTV